MFTNKHGVATYRCVNTVQRGDNRFNNYTALLRKIDF